MPTRGEAPCPPGPILEPRVPDTPVQIAPEKNYFFWIDPGQAGRAGGVYCPELVPGQVRRRGAVAQRSGHRRSQAAPRRQPVADALTGSQGPRPQLVGRRRLLSCDLVADRDLPMAAHMVG